MVIHRHIPCNVYEHCVSANSNIELEKLTVAAVELKSWLSGRGAPTNSTEKSNLLDSMAT